MAERSLTPDELALYEKHSREFADTWRDQFPPGTEFLVMSDAGSNARGLEELEPDGFDWPSEEEAEATRRLAQEITRPG